MKMQSDCELEELEVHARPDGLYDIFVRRNIEQDGDVWTADEVQLIAQTSTEVDTKVVWNDEVTVDEKINKCLALIEYMAIMTDVEIGE